MKFTALALLPLAFCDPTIEKTTATSFLQKAKDKAKGLGHGFKNRVKGTGDYIKESSSNAGAGIVNLSKESGKEASMYFENNLDSLEAWEEWKDGLEEMDLPEQEVDNLESCVSKCWAKDKLLDFVGRAFEETRETYEEAVEKGMDLKSQRPIPCPQCCETIPKALGDLEKNWPQISGTCRNVKNERKVQVESEAKENTDHLYED